MKFSTVLLWTCLYFLYRTKKCVTDTSYNYSAEYYDESSTSLPQMDTNSTYEEDDFSDLYNTKQTLFAPQYTSYHEGEKSLHDFSFDLFNAVQKRKQGVNMIISPLSVYTALTMLRPALDGPSLSQVHDVLGSSKLNNERVGDMLSAIYHHNNEDTIKHANRVYVDQHIEVNPTYKNTLKMLRLGGIEKTNLSSNPSASREKINNFVAERTNNIIRNLLPPIDRLTRVVLINTLYLKADWRDRFSTENTINKPFYLANNRTIMVPTMHEQSMRCTIHRDTNYNADVTVLSLEGNLSMLIVMPKKAGQFSDLFDNEQNSTKNKFKKIFNAVWTNNNDRGDRNVEFCNLELPKFNTYNKTDLKQTLKSMGVKDIFRQLKANLSRLENRKEGNSTQMYVSHMHHEAMMKVNEKGVKGAAATSAHIDVTSARGRSVQINKPFLFVIRQDLTGAILFAGRVTRPQTT